MADYNKNDPDDLETETCDFCPFEDGEHDENCPNNDGGEEGNEEDEDEDEE